MASVSPERIRVVAFRENDGWVAQCIEYDIATQAHDLDTLVSRMRLTIEAEAQYTTEHCGAPFAGIGPAPAYFETMFDSVQASLCRDDFSCERETEMRIAA